MSRLTRDGTAEAVSRDRILRHARGQGNVHFPCSADHLQDWQPYPVDPYSAICDDDSPGHVRWNRQTDPRMLDAHQAVPTGALRSTERPECLRRRQSRPSCMDAVRGPFARNTTPNSAPYSTESCSVSSGHSARQKRQDHRMTSYNRALEITRCESIETTLRTRKRLWAGTLLRMSGGRLPKRIVFENLEGAVRRGRGGKEIEWTDCVQSDIRAFGIAGHWQATALKAEVWVEMVGWAEVYGHVE